MDIYLFSFIILAFGSLVITALVMYGHSHKLQDELRELDEEYSHAVNSLDFKTQRLVALEEAVEYKESRIRELERERLACVTCTPTLKKKV